jgi:hypothetical protein
VIEGTNFPRTGDDSARARTLLSRAVPPEQQSGALVGDEQEEKLSSFVWIACSACGTPVRLSDTVRDQNGLRVCPACFD